MKIKRDEIATVLHFYVSQYTPSKPTAYNLGYAYPRLGNVAIGRYFICVTT
jgi:hypothetical protein